VGQPNYTSLHFDFHSSTFVGKELEDALWPPMANKKLRSFKLKHGATELHDAQTRYRG
jgi:hypothetical protein